MVCVININIILSCEYDVVFLVMFSLCGMSCVFGIISICLPGWTQGTGIWGTFFGWLAAMLGLCGSKQSVNQPCLLSGHITLVSYSVCTSNILLEMLTYLILSQKRNNTCFTYCYSHT